MIGDILQPTHLLFVLVVALLVLGPKRLPEAGRALGRGIRDFRSAMSGDDDHHNAISSETAAAPAPASTAPAAQPNPPATQPEAPAQPAAATMDEPVEQPTEIAHPMG